MSKGCRFHNFVVALAAASLPLLSPPAFSEERGVASGKPSFTTQQKSQSTPETSPVQPLAQEELGTIRRDLRDLQIQLTATQTAVGDQRNLIYIVLTALFAIIIGFLAVVGWAEAKFRAGTKRLDEAVAAALDALAARSEEHMSLYDSRLKEITGRYLPSRALQDLILSGKVLYWMGKASEAAVPLGEAVALVPTDPEARKYRGLVMRRLGPDRLAEAIADLEIAVASDTFALDPEAHFALTLCYVATRQWDLAIDQARRAQQAGYQNSEEIQTTIAEALKGKRAFGEAEAIYSAVIAQNARCTPAILGKGAILTFQERYDEAIDLYSTAIRERGGVSDYHVYRAVAYARRNSEGDWERATQDFAQAEKISPSDWDLWFWRGKVHADRALAVKARPISRSDPDIKAAIEYFEGGIRNAKKAVTPRFRNQLCRIFLLVGEGARALAEARKSVEANRAFVQNHMLLATACLALQRWPDAIIAARNGKEISRDPPGRIWCLYFEIYALSFQHHDPTSLRPQLASLVKELSTALYFDPTLWDVEYVEQANAADLARLPEKSRALLQDTRQALSEPANAMKLLGHWV